MFSINSVLIYRSRICRVMDIREETFGKTKKMYFILGPLYDDKNTIYVPLDNPQLTSKMKTVLTEEEMLSLIENTSDSSLEWVNNNKERPSILKDILESGDREKIILVIKALKEHRDKLASLGKCLHSSDEIMLQRAEKTIYDEIAFIFGIEPKNVGEFLKSKNAQF